MNIPKKSLTLLLTSIVSISLIAFSLWLSGRLDDLSIFLYINFVLPLGHYYTPVNTVVYGLILAIAIPLVSRLLSILNVKVDERLIFSIIPYILIGSSVRALNDSEVFNSVFFVSPPIYFVIFGYALVCLVLSLFMCRKLGWSYHILFSLFGLILLTYLAYLIIFVEGCKNMSGALLVMEYTFVATLISVPMIVLIHRIIGLKTLSIAILIMVAHLLDASATHVAVSYYGYSEQHPLPTLLAKLFGTTIILIPIKLSVLLVVMIALDRFLREENTQLSEVIKLTLLTLGLAPGMRDLLRLVMNV